MSNSHSIMFQAGPYRGWELSIAEIRTGDSKPALLVQLAQPDVDCRSGRGRGDLVFLQHTPGHDVMLTALNEPGRQPMERALTWILDQTAGRLADDETIDPKLRGHWQPIVNAGRAARDEYQARWGDEGEPAFLAIGAVVVTVDLLEGVSR